MIFLKKSDEVLSVQLRGGVLTWMRGEMCVLGWTGQNRIGRRLVQEDCCYCGVNPGIIARPDENSQKRKPPDSFLFVSEIRCEKCKVINTRKKEQRRKHCGQRHAHRLGNADDFGIVVFSK